MMIVRFCCCGFTFSIPNCFIRDSLLLPYLYTIHTRTTTTTTDHLSILHPFFITPTNPLYSSKKICIPSRFFNIISARVTQQQLWFILCDSEKILYNFLCMSVQLCYFYRHCSRYLLWSEFRVGLDVNNSGRIRNNPRLSLASFSPACSLLEFGFLSFYSFLLSCCWFVCYPVTIITRSSALHTRWKKEWINKNECHPVYLCVVWEWNACVHL